VVECCAVRCVTARIIGPLVAFSSRRTFEPESNGALLNHFVTQPNAWLDSGACASSVLPSGDSTGREGDRSRPAGVRFAAVVASPMTVRILAVVLTQRLVELLVISISIGAFGSTRGCCGELGIVPRADVIRHGILGEGCTRKAPCTNTRKGVFVSVIVRISELSGLLYQVGPMANLRGADGGVLNLLALIPALGAAGGRGV